jgi:hypothetical protein
MVTVDAPVAVRRLVVVSDAPTRSGPVNPRCRV